ncbi:zinc metallopeptidase motif-containing protein [Thermus phage MN1]|nr:zinc metallopeptidase motif-containing protein [Thermus phage MN1]
MDISLVKLILLLGALLRYGHPQEWDTALQVRLSLSLPGPGVVVGVNIDPIPIYHRSLPGNLCGLYDGAIVVDPSAPEKGCRDTLEHELAHAWQVRSYGLVQPITYAFSPGLWEPNPPWAGAPSAPRALEFSLIRIWLPIDF